MSLMGAEKIRARSAANKIGKIKIKCIEGGCPISHLLLGHVVAHLRVGHMRVETAALCEELQPAAALLCPESALTYHRFAIVYGSTIMIAIVESPLCDIATATLIEVLQIGIEISMSHGREHGKEEGICVNHIDKVRIATIEFLMWPATQETWPGGIEACDACQWLKHIIGHHAGHLCPQAEANQMYLLASIDARTEQIVNELCQALGHYRSILHCPRIIAGPAHQTLVIHRDHMHRLCLQQHIAHLQIGCQAAITNESMDEYLERQTWLKELQLRLKWIQLHRCIPCIATQKGIRLDYQTRISLGL